MAGFIDTQSGLGVAGGWGLPGAGGEGTRGVTFTVHKAPRHREEKARQVPGSSSDSGTGAFGHWEIE